MGSTRTSSNTSYSTPARLRDAMVSETGGRVAIIASVTINTFFAPMFTISSPTSAVTPGPKRRFEDLNSNA